MTNYDVMKKLLGPVEPVGDSRVDEKRLENLDATIELAGRLLRDINEVAGENKNRQEASMRIAGRRAEQFMVSVAEEYFPKE